MNLFNSIQIKFFAQSKKKCKLQKKFAIYNNFRARGAEQMFRARGAALIMVLVTLTILIFLVVPFAVSMRVATRSSSNRILEIKAQLAAQGAIEYGISRLSRTTDHAERFEPQPKLYKTPDYDSPQEYQVELDLPLEINNPQGILCSLTIEDEQGKIPLNSTSPWLIGNLMGSALTTQATKSSDTEIVVDSTLHFWPQGGLLWINGELIEYQKAEEKRFIACKRGLFADSPRFLSPQNFPAGTLVLSARAYRICRHRLLRQDGSFTPYRTTEEICSIADSGAYSITYPEYQKIAPFLTVYSGSDLKISWIHEQRIQNKLPSQALNENAPETVQVLDATVFAPGQTVRIQQENSKVYAMVLAVLPNAVVLDIHSPQIFDKGIATISILQNHGININSAQPRVLYALFKGISSENHNNWIDAREAEILASSIFGMREQGGAFKSTADLEQFLKNLQQQLRATKTEDLSGNPALQDSEILALLTSSIRCEAIRPRFAGINIPVQKEGYATVWPPITSLVYRNSDVYTLEGTAILHNEEEIPLVQHTASKIVQVAPHHTLIWKIESQKDFTNYLQQLSGYRVITWPNLVSIPPAYAESNPEHPETGLSLDTVPLYPTLPHGMNSQSYEPWNNTHEGITCPNQQPTIKLEMGTKEILPGSLSLWFYPPKSRTSYSIFDLGTQEFQDRMTLYYDRGELIFQVADANMQSKCAEVWVPLDLESRWYHIRVAWHSTSPGGLDLWVDGKPVGEFTYRHNNIRYRTALADDVEIGAKNIPVADTTGLPSEGVINIGDEAIEYSRIAGHILVVRDSYPNTTWDTVCRGARGTTMAEHPKGAWVTEFGYSDLLASDNFPATELAFQFPEAGSLAVNLRSALSVGGDTIKASANQFPPRGVVLIAYINLENQLFKEIIRYGNNSNNQFGDCERGLYNTSAQEFPANESYVFPLSMFVKDTSLYEDSGLVQLGDEWISYESKLDQNIFLLATKFSDELVRDWVQDAKSGRKYRTNFRCRALTTSKDYDYGTKVIPVFKTQTGWLGKYDKVTILSGTNTQQREAMEVSWAYGRHAAFTSDLKYTYKSGNNTRIIKFPSGELPTQATPIAYGKSVTSSRTSQFGMDELHLVQSKERSSFRLAKLLDSSASEIPLRSAVGLNPADAGLLKIGNEYISYNSMADKQCQDAIRGFSQTKPGIYSAGTILYSAQYLPISFLQAVLDKSKHEFVVQNPYDFPAEGYINCEDEIIGYTSKSDNKLSMPILTNGPGLLRGCYGTKPGVHSVGSIVYVMPIRYWDRDLKGYDGPQGAYFSATKTAPGAWWKKLHWQEDNPYIASLVTAVHARMDGRPDWSSPPTNQPGGIYEFTSPHEPNLLQCRGDSLELRVYFRYLPNAYRLGHWTSKIMLKNITVEYLQATRVLQSESSVPTD